MTVYKITYKDAGHLGGFPGEYGNQPVVTRFSCYRFVIERDWVLFREDDDDQTVKLAISASDVLSIQDLGDEVVESD